MLTGGIDAIAAAQPLNTAQDILRAAGWDVVQVQRDDITPGHIVGLSAGAGQRASHKAAHILEVILLGLFHIQIFCQGLSASGGGLELCPQLRDEQGLLQRQLAAFLEIDTPMYSKIERGDRRAKREQVIKLAEYLHQDEKEMLTLWLADKFIDAVEGEQERDLCNDAIIIAQEIIRAM